MSEGKRFVRGHWSRSPEARIVATARRKGRIGEPNTTGLCACGCGVITPIATDNHPERGYYKGEHVRFINGHQMGKGADHPTWGGGRSVTPSGYVYLYAPDHPHTNANGYVYEHRMVVEQRIGRFLDPGERVHHLNHNRADNRDENLVLFQSHSAHMREEHPQALTQWLRRNPELAKAIQQAAGKKGAESRWRAKR